jgi:arsenite methyltransferase
MTKTSDAEAIRAAVRARYGSAARAASMPAPQACCGTGFEKDVISSDLYGVEDIAHLPTAATLASLGCGNPTTLADLKPGEVVLDLGSGGGIDVLLSAKRVGPSGFAYGVDMTDEMLALAERNAAERGVDNVRFLKGEIEHIPLPDNSVDVVISNCVVNLSADKPQVLREAFRVLRPGGRFAVSDVVVQGSLPQQARQNIELWAGCVAGALEEEEYRILLGGAGFECIEVDVTRVYDTLGLSAEDTALSTEAHAALVASHGRLVSAFVRATKPWRTHVADGAENAGSRAG